MKKKFDTEKALFSFLEILAVKETSEMMERWHQNKAITPTIRIPRCLLIDNPNMDLDNIQFDEQKIELLKQYFYKRRERTINYEREKT